MASHESHLSSGPGWDVENFENTGDIRQVPVYLRGINVVFTEDDQVNLQVYFDIPNKYLHTNIEIEDMEEGVYKVDPSFLQTVKAFKQEHTLVVEDIKNVPMFMLLQNISNARMSQGKESYQIVGFRSLLQDREVLFTSGVHSGSENQVKLPSIQCLGNRSLPNSFFGLTNAAQEIAEINKQREEYSNNKSASEDTPQKDSMYRARFMKAMEILEETQEELKELRALLRQHMAQRSESPDTNPQKEGTLP